MTVSVRDTTSHTLSKASFVGFVLMAGGLRPSPLREQLGVPSLCLPVGPGVTLLDRWVQAAAAVSGCESMVIAVSDHSDASCIRNHLHERRSRGVEDHIQVHVVMEHATWRGPAGTLYDLLNSGQWGLQRNERTVLIAGEAACLPPEDLNAVVNAVGLFSPGISATSQSGQPLGLYAFTELALRDIPALGYYDIKEQLLPALYARRTPVQAMSLATQSLRIWDLESYHRVVKAHQQYDSSHDHPDTEQAPLTDRAQLAGCCLIEAGASVHADAIIHDSIVLAGAVIGQGAVVSQSVIGPGALVRPGSVVRRSVVASKVHARAGVAHRTVSQIRGLGSMFRGEQLS